MPLTVIITSAASPRRQIGWADKAEHAANLSGRPKWTSACAPRGLCAIRVSNANVWLSTIQCTLPAERHDHDAASAAFGIVGGPSRNCMPAAAHTGRFPTIRRSSPWSIIDCSTAPEGSCAKTLSRHRNAERRDIQRRGGLAQKQSAENVGYQVTQHTRRKTAKERERERQRVVNYAASTTHLHGAALTTRSSRGSLDYSSPLHRAATS